MYPVWESNQGDFMGANAMKEYRFRWAPKTIVYRKSVSKIYEKQELGVYDGTGFHASYPGMQVAWADKAPEHTYFPIDQDHEH